MLVMRSYGLGRGQDYVGDPNTSATSTRVHNQLIPFLDFWRSGLLYNRTYDVGHLEGIYTEDKGR